MQSRFLLNLPKNDGFDNTSKKIVGNHGTHGTNGNNKENPEVILRDLAWELKDVSKNFGIFG